MCPEFVSSTHVLARFTFTCLVNFVKSKIPKIYTHFHLAHSPHHEYIVNPSLAYPFVHRNPRLPQYQGGFGPPIPVVRQPRSLIYTHHHYTLTTQVNGAVARGLRFNFDPLVGNLVFLAHSFVVCLIFTLCVYF